MLLKVFAFAFLLTAAEFVRSEDNTEDLPTEADVGSEVIQEKSSTKEEDKGVRKVRQSEAANVVSILNNEITQKVIKSLQQFPEEVELAPPEDLLLAKVGRYTIPIIYRVGNDTKRDTYVIEVTGVDECNDESPPDDWKHACHGTFTKCENMDNGYDCVCVSGTEGNLPCQGKKSSMECTHTCRDIAHLHGHDITKCEEMFSCSPVEECGQSSDCNAAAICTETECEPLADTCEGTYNCACRDGFVGDGKGETGCSNVDECKNAKNSCHKFADCTDETPSAADNWTNKFSCKCKEGFSGDGYRRCIPAQLCKLVQEAGACHEKATCAPCSEDDVDCRQSPRPEVSEGNFKCECASHYQGNGFKDSEGCVAIDYCTDPVHVHDCNENAECTNTGNGEYTCTCIAGLETVGDGRGKHGCKDVNECADYTKHDCHVGAICENKTPSKTNPDAKYDCKCDEKHGWHANRAAEKPLPW
eukprot:g4326.t1